MLDRLRGKYSEPYRIRNGWGLSPIRNKREETALIDFCKEQLKDRSYMKLNPERKEIYQTTVKFYKKYGCIDSRYVRDHTSWYWS
jgi:hypothetical protein